MAAKALTGKLGGPQLLIKGCDEDEKKKKRLGPMKNLFIIVWRCSLYKVLSGLATTTRQSFPVDESEITTRLARTRGSTCVKAEGDRMAATLNYLIWKEVSQLQPWIKTCGNSQPRISELT